MREEIHPHVMKKNIDIQNTISNVWEYLDKYIEIIYIYIEGGMWAQDNIISITIYIWGIPIKYVGNVYC